MPKQSVTLSDVFVEMEKHKAELHLDDWAICNTSMCFCDQKKKHTILMHHSNSHYTVILTYLGLLRHNISALEEVFHRVVGEEVNDKPEIEEADSDEEDDEDEEEETEQHNSTGTESSSDEEDAQDKGKQKEK